MSANLELNGYINVKDFGAVGDGLADDTAAILEAIKSAPAFDPKHPFRVRPIFFPAGVYTVTDTIARRNSSGGFDANLALIGDSVSSVTIKLKNNSRGFGKLDRKPVVLFASSLLAGSPSAGGKNYMSKGEGNDAYQNFLQDITIDCGESNPGAVAVDYLSNNVGAIRNVRLIAAGGGAQTGISMLRKWIGPALIQNVSIHNFHIGIDINQTEYSVTMDGVNITGSSVVGLRNADNLVSFYDLTIAPQSGVGLANLTRAGLVVGERLAITGDYSMPVFNRGFMNLKDLKIAKRESSSALPMSGITQDGVFEAMHKVDETRFALSGSNTPKQPSLSHQHVATPAAYGASGDGVTDDTDALQRTLNSGCSDIVLHNGVYRVSRSLTVPDTVSSIDGSYSTIIYASGGKDPTPVDGILSIAAPSHDRLFIKHLVFENLSSTSATAVKHLSSRQLILSDIVASGMNLIQREAKGGEIWGDNLLGSSFSFSGTAGVWLKQTDTEGKGIRIRNNGAKLWMLGTKTENNMTLLANSGGGIVNLLGVFAYKLSDDGITRPYLDNEAGVIAATIAEEAFSATATFQTWLNDQPEGREFRSEDFPFRHGYGRMIPQIVSGQTYTIQH